MSPCTKTYEIPDEPYTFGNITYTIGDPTLHVNFAGVSLNNCAFSLSVEDASASQGASDPESIPNQEINEDVFTLIQPVLATDPLLDERIISVVKYGALEIETPDLQYVHKVFSLQLLLNSFRFVGEVDSETMDFQVTFIPCVSVAEDTQIFYDELTYKIGDPLMPVSFVSVFNTTCTNSNLAIKDSKLVSDAFLVTNYT